MLKHTLLTLLTLLPFASADARAACLTYTGGAGFTGAAPIKIGPFNTQNFDPDVQDGTVLFEQEVLPRGGDGWRVSCPGPNGVRNIFHGRVNQATHPVHHTYPTGIDGVGVRLQWVSNSVWWPWSFTHYQNDIYFSFSNNIRVQLVKTGPITVGGRLTGELAGSWAQDQTYQYISYQIDGSLVLKPTVPTCTVDSGSKSIDVRLGSVSTGAIPDASSPGNANGKPFSIYLTCSGGTQNATTRMYITLSDISSPGNRSDVLSLATGSGATGVGVRIMNGNTPVSFGPNSNASGVQNQWFVTQTGNRQVEIPLTAYYVKTGQPIKGGEASAVAVFNMSYQ